MNDTAPKVAFAAMSPSQQFAALANLAHAGHPIKTISDVTGAAPLEIAKALRVVRPPQEAWQ